MQRQLLWLMYIDSRHVENRKICLRDLRSAEKYIFKVDIGKYIFKVDIGIEIGTKYQGSPFYIGTLLWNELNANTQFARDIIQFKQLTGKKYAVYEKLV